MDGSTRGNGSSSILSHFDRSAQRPLGLVKQAYSAYVTISPGSQPRKWHLTAYFTYADLQHLPTIDSDQILRSLPIPPGVYRSGKARSRNSDLIVDTASHAQGSSVGSSVPSSPSSAPRMMGASTGASNFQMHPGSSAQSPILPPLHAAVSGIDVPPGPASPSRESRWSEDQRVIQMLNSRHIR